MLIFLFNSEIYEYWIVFGYWISNWRLISIEHISMFIVFYVTVHIEWYWIVLNIEQICINRNWITLNWVMRIGSVHISMLTFLMLNALQLLWQLVNADCVCLCLSFAASKKLSDIINRPFDLYQEGIADTYMAGFMNQVSQAVDDAVTTEVSHFRLLYVIGVFRSIPN